MTRAAFDAQLGPLGAMLIGEPDEVVAKIIRHSEALARAPTLRKEFSGAGS